MGLRNLNTFEDGGSFLDLVGDTWGVVFSSFFFFSPWSAGGSALVFMCQAGLGCLLSLVALVVYFRPATRDPHWLKMAWYSWHRPTEQTDPQLDKKPIKKAHGPASLQHNRSEEK